jgi:hypothetical protein
MKRSTTLTQKKGNYKRRLILRHLSNRLHGSRSTEESASALGEGIKALGAGVKELGVGVEEATE